MSAPHPETGALESGHSRRYYYPNRMGRILLLAIEDVIGHTGLTAVMKLAGYENIGNPLPPNNTDRQFAFETLSRLMEALDALYGPRGARSVALRVGRVCFKYGLREYGPVVGIGELTFQLLPLSIKLEKGIRLFADVFNSFTDQVVRVEETPDTFYWYVERCPVCWDRQTDQPSCHLSVGVLQEALLWVSGGKTFQVEEQACVACGDEACIIAITKTPLD